MREPDFKGEGTAAWLLTPENTTPDHEASISSWLLTGPFHPAWNQWVLTMIHLRDIPGVKPATIKREGATHEVVIMSVDPKHPVTEAIAQAGMCKYLTPPDLMHQFECPDDATADRIAMLMARAVVDQIASPDSDFAGRWPQIIENTIAHERGEHAH